MDKDGRTPFVSKVNLAGTITLLGVAAVAAAATAVVFKSLCCCCFWDSVTTSDRASVLFPLFKTTLESFIAQCATVLIAAFWPSFFVFSLLFLFLLFFLVFLFLLLSCLPSPSELPDLGYDVDKGTEVPVASATTAPPAATPTTTAAGEGVKDKRQSMLRSSKRLDGACACACSCSCACVWLFPKLRVVFCVYLHALTGLCVFACADWLVCLAAKSASSRLLNSVDAKYKEENKAERVR